MIHHPDARLVRLVMAGAAKEWLWLRPEELGIGNAGDGFEALEDSPAARERAERLRIETQRAALLLWWKTGRFAAIRVALLRAIGIGRLRHSDGRPA